MMSLTDIFFRLEGRLGRLSYLGYSLLATLAAALLIVLGFGIISMNNPAGALGLVPIFLGVMGLFWSHLALTVKRLHDIGLSGLHMVWIWGIDLLPGIFSAQPSLAMVLNVLSILVGLWVLLTPGEKRDNLYGAQPIQPAH